MKKCFLIAFIQIFIAIFSIVAQNTYTDPNQSTDVQFRLFRTTNVWTFLKLDTSDGRIWQVQFDVKGDERFTVVLNAAPLVGNNDKLNGRFTLFPTNNMFNFLLLDQINGDVWQVQWSQDKKNRGIIPIEN